MSSDLRIVFTAAPAALRLSGRGDGPGPRRPRPRREANRPAGATPSETGASAAAGAKASKPRAASGAADGGETTTAATPTDTPPPAWALQLDRFDRVMTRLEAEATRLPSSVAEALQAMEPDLVRLALAAASQVLRRRFDEGEEELSRLVSDALGRITRGIEKRETVRVLVAAEDLEALSAAVGDRAGVEFEADEGRPAGTVEVRCGLRRIGVDVAREIDRLADRLLGDGGREERTDD